MEENRIMNKRRRTLLLALPLVLGALLGAAKWKQLHPAPTQFDLQERAFLRNSKIVRVTVEGKGVELPSAEFKATLDDFYLTDAGDDLMLALAKSSARKRQNEPAIDIKVAYEINNESAPFAGIRLDSISFYNANRVTRGRTSQQQKTVVALIHPVTERRLRELVAKYRPAR